MKRHSIASLILSLFLLALPLLALAAAPAGAAPAGAAIWYVDAASGDDGNGCLSPGDACATIGEAVSRAADGDTVQIAAGVYPEFLDLDSDLLLVGAGPESTILDGEGARRVLQLSGIADVTASSLAIRGGWKAGSEGGGAIRNLGRLTLDDAHVYDNASEGFGGAIYNNGQLFVQNSEIFSNTTSGTGGGLFNWYAGTITITGSLISGNDASQGGAIYTLADLWLSDSTLQANTVAQFGGGLAIFGGQSVLERVTVRDNMAISYGGGLLNNIGDLRLINSTISGNEAPNQAGLSNLSSSASATVVNSTISANRTTGPGTTYGGIVNSGYLTITNSIAAGNDGRQCQANGTWISLGHNLSSDTHCDFTGPGDLQNADPLLAPLGEYGGPTATHVPLAGSPAIDAGDAAACRATDQRGVARPVDGDGDGAASCDIGAVETRAQLAVSDVVVAEGDAGTTAAVFTVTLAPTSTDVITVTYATADGSASAGEDYEAVGDVLTFSPGQESQTVSVTIHGDGDDEPDETFTLDLGPAGNADIVDGRGLATIVDDDGLSSLTVADMTVVEGDSGTTQAAFVVTLSPAAAGEVTVEYATVAGTAEETIAPDYAADAGLLTFAAGETSQVIEIAVYGDVVDEGTSETFSLVLSNPSGANLADGEAAGTITDDDTAQISMGFPVEVAEGDAGTTPALFEVTLSTPTAFPVTVDFHTQSAVGGDQFAVPGEDYVAISGTLTFDPGQTAQTITVQILGDTDSELNETFSVYLTNPSPITILYSAAGGTILDDDQRMYLPFLWRGES